MVFREFHMKTERQSEIRETDATQHTYTLKDECRRKDRNMNIAYQITV